MRIGILCAGDREAAPFLPVIQDKTESHKAMLTFVQGHIHGVDVVALYSGVCKVNAAIAAQILIDSFGVDAVINAGTAGGMHPGVGLLDCVVSTKAAYHDVAPDLLTEFHPWMEDVFFHADDHLLGLTRKAVRRLGLEERVHWGLMATGEAFISEEGREQINQRLAPLSVDMETAAIAHVCYVNCVPFLAIRCITDDAAHSGLGYFEENCVKAAAIARDVTVALLEEIKQETAP